MSLRYGRGPRLSEPRVPCVSGDSDPALAPRALWSEKDMPAVQWNIQWSIQYLLSFLDAGFIWITPPAKVQSRSLG